MPLQLTLVLGSGEIAFLSICVLVWLLVLATALSRKDLDPVTRLMWVLVIILVPIFGVLLYWFVAPHAARKPHQKDLAPPPNDSTISVMMCPHCETTIPPGSSRCPNCGWPDSEA